MKWHRLKWSFLLADVWNQFHPPSGPGDSPQEARMTSQPGWDVSPYTHGNLWWCDRINCTGHWGAWRLARGSWENKALWIQQCQRKRLSQTRNVLVPRAFQLGVVLQWSWNQRKGSFLNGPYSSPLLQTPTKLSSLVLLLQWLSFWLTKFII